MTRDQDSHGNTVGNSQRSYTMETSINRKVAKQSMVYSHNRILYPVGLNEVQLHVKEGNLGSTVWSEK